MFISVCAFSLMDVLVKWSDSYPVGQVLFFMKNKTCPTGYESDHFTNTSISEKAHTEMNM